MPTLYIIDTFAQIFRAYYAIRNGMRSPVTGEPTQAVFGVAALLLRLLKEQKPEYVVAASDAPGKTFRDTLYADYKATRRATPEDLIPQIPRVIELLEGFGIPVLQQEGLEADDVIASIVRQMQERAEGADLTIRILSKDKDLEQILCERVHLYDLQTDTLTDRPALLANKGITPEQVVDVLALTGDTVDNVPGVEGIGPKTAVQLVTEFGSIDGIYANLERIKGKRRTNLEKARDTIGLSRELVTLKRDAAVPFSLSDAQVRPPHLERLLPLFQQLGFNRFQHDVRRLAGEGEAALPGLEPGTGAAAGTGPESADSPASLLGADAPDAARPVGGEYRAVCTLEELRDLAVALRQAPLVSVDTETTGLERSARLCGLCLAWEPGRAVYVPVRSPEPERHLDEATVLAELGPLLSDPTLPKCGHNLKFDARVLARSGVLLRGVVFDSMLAVALLDPTVNGKLDLLAERLLGLKLIPITDLIGAGAEQTTMESVPLEQITPYAAEDADVALRLCHVLLPRLEEHGMAALLREVEAPLAVVLAEMELAGILCDPAELRQQGQALGTRVDALREEIQERAGRKFALDSPKQLAEVLFDHLGFSVVKKTKTGRSTDVEVLERLAAQEDRNVPHTRIPRLLMEYRQLTKLISTYLGNLVEAIDPETGRVHSSFHQLVTATGRLASHGPNLQNIPVRTDIGRQVRKAFPAPEGHVLICADYSQIELRLLAHLSEDPGLVRAFEEEQDIHTAVASRVFGAPPEAVTREQRSHAKTINFGIIYGISAHGLSRRIEGLDREAAGKLIGDYKQQFPGIDTFLQECIRHAEEHGYVKTLLGRRRAIPEIRARSATERHLGERLAINTVVQGSAADLIKLAMVNVQRRIDRDRLPLRLLLQIHDELVFEAPAAAAADLAELVRGEMEDALVLKVPLRAEAGVGPDWMSAK